MVHIDFGESDGAKPQTCEDQVATRVNAHPPRLFVYDIMICSAKIREVGNHTLREQEIASCDQSKTSDI